MNFRFYITLSLFYLLQTTSVGQQKDFIGLGGISADYKLNRRLDIGAGTQFIFNQNLQELWIGFSDISIGYRLSRKLQTELHARFIQFRNLDNFYENRTLFYHTLTYSEYLKKFSISIRHRTQQLIYGEHFNDSFRMPRWYIRDRISLRYRINYYWSLVGATEVFFPLNHPTRKGIDQFRVLAGLSYTWNEKIGIQPYYQIQQQLRRSSGNDTFYLIGLLVSLNL